jgi:hypothetical protein
VKTNKAAIGRFNIPGAKTVKPEEIAVKLGLSRLRSSVYLKDQGEAGNGFVHRIRDPAEIKA